jgi:arginine metabolism regulation protein II
MGIECGGYGVRLRWMTDPFADGETSHAGAGQHKGRSRIGLSSHTLLQYSITDNSQDHNDILGYSADTVDEFLASVDSHVTCGQSFRRGPFSVLSIDPGRDNRYESPVVASSESIRAREAGDASSFSQFSSNDDVVELGTTPPKLTTNDVIPSQEDEAATENLQLPGEMNLLEMQIMTIGPTHRIAGIHTIDACDVISGMEQFLRTESSENAHGATPYQIPPAHPLAWPSSISFSGDRTMDMLMHHYTVNIASLLQPISHPQNPYRDLYVPAALEVAAISLPSVDVEQGTIHTALFHSLLASSAFHLSFRTSKTVTYHKLGAKHKQHAMSLLQVAIDGPSSVLNHQVLLMTMLSLVTVDVSQYGRFLRRRN